MHKLSLMETRNLYLCDQGEHFCYFSKKTHPASQRVVLNIQKSTSQIWFFFTFANPSCYSRSVSPLLMIPLGLATTIFLSGEHFTSRILIWHKGTSEQLPARTSSQFVHPIKVARLNCTHNSFMNNPGLHRFWKLGSATIKLYTWYILVSTVNRV